ncbi:MAG TPA: hypothetical protein VF288_10585 [Mycobacteriales bacterium]
MTTRLYLSIDIVLDAPHPWCSDTPPGLVVHPVGVPEESVLAGLRHEEQIGVAYAAAYYRAEQ